MNTSKKVLIVILISGLFGLCKPAFSQTETFSAGAFIIDMGVVPQTVGNALKPYGLIYHLIMEHAVKIDWIIDPLKAKDGIDFSYNGYNYKGGPFLIPAEYRTPDVNTEIAYWQSLGVIGTTTTSPVTVPIFKEVDISSAPRWTLDKQNGSLAQPYFANAGIPASAYGGASSSSWKNPADLNCCDDIFVMPHADPTWATHSNLLNWNLNCKGAIWLACHAGSALEDMFNPSNPSQQTNFLSEKNVTASGAGPYYENALTLWSNHDDGTPPYSYDNGGDPVMQFMGTIDAATQSGSEQIYIPKSAGWRPTTVVGGFDPDNTQRYLLSDLYKYRAAVIAYGKGFGDPERGMVMLEAGHSLNKAQLPANIAAQRAFFNFSLLAAKTTAPDPGFVVSFGTLTSGDTVPLSFTISLPRTINEFNVLWSSSCGGSFIPNNAQSVDFIVPQVSGSANCVITIQLTEKSICARVYKSSTSVPIVCGLQVLTTVSPACFGLTNGSINMNITGGPAPYVWTWTKSGGGSDSGTGTLISNLATGTYTVVVTAENGTGCAKTFTVTINENLQLNTSATSTNPICNGGLTGNITLSVNGGTPGYTYLWSDGSNIQNRSGIGAGNYNVTVTDSKGCTNTATATITQPEAISITPDITNINCYGNSTGAISLSVTGGTGAYTYAWNDGQTIKDRTGLIAGTYSVTVTDGNFCIKSLTGISLTQAEAISASASAGTISCNGGITTLTVTASGGTGSLQYNLNGGAYQSDNTFTVTASSSAYNITVKDANNCTKTTSVLVTQPTTLILSSEITHETCPGTHDGAINITVSGGTSPYNYDWADIPGTNNDEDRTGLEDGSYTVTITDSHGCTVSAIVIVNTINNNPIQPGNIIY